MDKDADVGPEAIRVTGPDREETISVEEFFGTNPLGLDLETLARVGIAAEDGRSVDVGNGITCRPLP